MADDNNDSLDEASDAKASVGDIFGVSAGKKKKKKKKKAEPKPEPKPEPEAAAVEELAGDDSIPFPDDAEQAERPHVPADDEPTRVVRQDKAEEKTRVERPSGKAAAAAADDDDLETVEPAPAPKPKKKKAANAAALDGVLLPDPAGGSDPIDTSSDYLGPADLGDFEAPKSKTVPVLIGIIVLLVVAMGGMMLSKNGLGGDLLALFKGNLREKRIEEAHMKEEAFKKEQLAKLDRFGNLVISGNPNYALVKMDGQMQYGPTSEGWREVRVGASQGIQDLNIKKPHQVEFSSPGFEPTTIDITRGKWQNSSGAYSYAVTPSLLPKSVQAKQEFDARMSPNADDEYDGTITINTIPSGADVIFDNHPLLDKDGNPLKTPVTFDKTYEKNEKTGKLEEHPVRVDTALDIGHKIQISMEYPNTCTQKGGKDPDCGPSDGCCPKMCTVADDKDCQYPKYVTSLMRPMWTCKWKDGAPPKEVGKKKTIQDYCDYTFQLDVDLNGLKNYIIARDKARKKVMAQYAGTNGGAGKADAKGKKGAVTAQAQPGTP